MHGHILIKPAITAHCQVHIVNVNVNVNVNRGLI